MTKIITLVPVGRGSNRITRIDGGDLDNILRRAADQFGYSRSVEINAYAVPPDAFREFETVYQLYNPNLGVIGYFRVEDLPHDAGRESDLPEWQRPQ